MEEKIVKQWTLKYPVISMYTKVIKTTLLLGLMVTINIICDQLVYCILSLHSLWTVQIWLNLK